MAATSGTLLLLLLLLSITPLARAMLTEEDELEHLHEQRSPVESAELDTDTAQSEHSLSGEKTSIVRRQLYASLEDQVRQCFRRVGWTYTPYPTYRPMWFWLPDRRRHLRNMRYGESHLSYQQNHYRLLQENLLKCQQALAARMTTPNPQVLMEKNRLDQRIKELGRLLRMCLDLGGRSFIRVPPQKRQSDVARRKAQTLEEQVLNLEATKALFEKEVEYCFAGIGRLPNGDPIPTTTTTTVTVVTTTTSSLTTTTPQPTTLC